LVYRPSSFHEYNADGLRTKKTTGNGTTQFVYDGTTLIAELDGNGNLVAVYTHGATGLISQRRGTVSHFYHFDGLGSTMELTDANEAVTDTYRYDAWGNVLASTGTTVNPYNPINGVDPKGTNWKLIASHGTYVIVFWIGGKVLTHLSGEKEWLPPEGNWLIKTLFDESVGGMVFDIVTDMPSLGKGLGAFETMLTGRMFRWKGWMWSLIIGSE
jgi:hypothetical protein